jgi:nicotinamide-nucleotide amidase
VTTDPPPVPRGPLLTATILSIGAELTVGDTRDTNAGELARALTVEGVAIERLVGVPDVLTVVREAFASALERSDVVLSTGGLGPTPDDLTREAIAAVCGEEPVVDPAIERWLRALWKRRGLPFPEINRKQAWVIPSAVTLPNPNGTAPGWYVTRPDGRIIVAMPGPPREMRPMWADEALPRLRDRGLGRPFAARTFRTAGIGESQLAEVLGEDILRGSNPEVATYARADAVDIRVSAFDGPGPDGLIRPAGEHVAAMAALVQARVGQHVWGEGSVTWASAIGASLEARGWRLAVEERGTGGQFAQLLGDVPWLTLAESWAESRPDHTDDAAALAASMAVRARAGTEVGLSVDAHEQGTDTIVTIALVAPGIEHVQRRTAFLGGAMGRVRAALAAAAAVVERLRAGAPD